MPAIFRAKSWRLMCCDTTELSRILEIIGEAANMLTTRFKDAHPDVAWRDISGMRNFLVHEYFRVDSDTVWAVIHSEIVELKEHIIHYLLETDWKEWEK